MKYCNKCGELIENCKCSKTKDVTINKKINNNKTNKCNKKRNKLPYIILPLITILLLAVGFFFIKSKVMSRTDVLNTFTEAISSKNADALQKVLYSEDSRLPINKDNCTILLEYFESNPSELNTINKILLKEDNSSEIPLSLEEVGKEFLLFPKYRICVQPVYINVKTNFPKINVKIKDKNYTDFDKTSEIGPLMPGRYELIADTNTKYLKTKEELSVNLFREPKSEITLFSDLKRINITSDKPDAKVYVDNIDTKLTVKDCRDFGPISSDCQIVGVIKEGDKTLITEPSSAYTDEVYLDFRNVQLMEDNFKERLFSFLESYCQDFAYSVNYNQFSYVSDYLEYGSQIYKEQEKSIPSIHNQDIRERFDSIELLDYTYDKSKNEGTITTKEIYGITIGVNPTKVETFKNKYNFKVDINGEFKLTKIKCL